MAGLAKVGETAEVMETMVTGTKSVKPAWASCAMPSAAQRRLVWIRVMQSGGCRRSSRGNGRTMKPGPVLKRRGAGKKRRRGADERRQSGQDVMPRSVQGVQPRSGRVAMQTSGRGVQKWTVTHANVIGSDVSARKRIGGDVLRSIRRSVMRPIDSNWSLASGTSQTSD